LHGSFSFSPEFASIVERKESIQAKGGSNCAQIMKTTLVRGQRAEDAQFAIVVLAVE
jgi:hypothetical protein